MPLRCGMDSRHKQHHCGIYRTAPSHTPTGHMPRSCVQGGHRNQSGRPGVRSAVNKRLLNRLRSIPLIGLPAWVLLSGCTGLAVVDALTPTDGYTVESGIAYGPGPRQKLDVYRPDPPVSNAPVVVFFYGGGWQGGDRARYRFVAQALTNRGNVVVVPDYRVYPQVRFPAFVEDGAAAVAWTATHLTPTGEEPLLVMGHSAGAHIAAMLITDTRYLETQGVDPERISGFIGLAGPYDFLPLDPGYLRTLFGPEDRYPDSQPVNFVSGEEPPVLLIHGSSDTTVWPRNSVRFAQRLSDRGAQVDLKLYPDVGHGPLVGALAPRFRDLAPTLDDVDAFLDGITRGETRTVAGTPGFTHH